MIIRPGPAARWNRLKVGVDTMSKFLAKAKIGQPFPTIEGFSLLRVFNFRLFNAYRLAGITRVWNLGNRKPRTVRQMRRRISRELSFHEFMSRAAAELHSWAGRLRAEEEAAERDRAERVAAANAAAAVSPPRRQFNLATAEGAPTPPRPINGKRKAVQYSADNELKRLRLNYDKDHVHEHCKELFEKPRPCALCSRWRQGWDGRTGRRTRKSGCALCRVALCQRCFGVWHRAPDLREVVFDAENRPVEDRDEH